MLIDYDKTAAEYEASLVTKLRGHGVGSFLESWVPDPDPVLGIFNMVEAAWTDGRSGLSLRVSRSTLDAQALERLQGLARGIAEIRSDDAGDDARVLTFARSGSAVADRGRAPAARSSVSHAVRGSPDGNRVAAREVEFALEPSLIPALESETAVFGHEGTIATVTGALGITSESSEGTVSLLVGQDDGLIRAARHSGVTAPVRRRVLEIMCRAIEGRTVQDASDHAGSYAIHLLQLRAGRRPARGILLPANAGFEVKAALGQIRKACEKYRERLGIRGSGNYFERRPAEPWDSMDRQEKLRTVSGAIAQFCQAEKLQVDAIKAMRVDKDVNKYEIRIVVQVDPPFPRDGVPSMLRHLERFLKARVEQALEVYLEPFRDQNVLRRL